MSQPALTLITDARLCLPDGTERQGTVLLENGIIRSITPDPPVALLLNHEDVEVINASEKYLTPGLIELHFNGALGCDLNRTNIASVQKLLGRLPEYGITSALLTAITAPLTDMLSAIHVLAAVVHHQSPQHCQPLGIHLEGPFINPQYRGAHPTADIRPFNREELEVLLSPMTRMITLAPELPSAEHAIRLLVEHGIRVTMGHSNADTQQARQAVDLGINSVTHLFNAMRPFHHRDPGLVVTALNDDRLYTQVIGDGAHVHPDVIRTVLRSKPLEKFLLTSDASPAAALPEGAQLEFGGQQVTVTKQKTINTEGVLAGSSQLVTDCVRNFVRWGLTDFATAIRFATANVANFLGEGDRGRLQEGQRADLVLWNAKTLAIESTWIQGELTYQKPIPERTPAEVKAKKNFKN
jgi:N-acetylglucosamine-6-phosphate deacetylase